MDIGTSVGADTGFAVGGAGASAVTPAQNGREGERGCHVAIGEGRRAGECGSRSSVPEICVSRGGEFR
jgi:hypothetical protein